MSLVREGENNVFPIQSIHRYTHAHICTHACTHSPSLSSAYFTFFLLSETNPLAGASCFLVCLLVCFFQHPSSFGILPFLFSRSSIFSPFGLRSLWVSLPSVPLLLNSLLLKLEILSLRCLLSPHSEGRGMNSVTDDSSFVLR